VMVAITKKVRRCIGRIFHAPGDRTASSGRKDTNGAPKLS